MISGFDLCGVHFISCLEGRSGFRINNFVNDIFTTIALYSETDVNKMVKEIIRMVSFIHPNVMPLTGVCTEGQSPLLIMPFMSNGNVLEYVRHHKEELMLTSEATDSKVILKALSHNFSILRAAHSYHTPLIEIS